MPDLAATATRPVLSRPGTVVPAWLPTPTLRAPTPRPIPTSAATKTVYGDGEAETGALTASWHSNKFLNPVTDGAVLPSTSINAAAG